MRCFISKNYRHTNSAGDKAKTDIEAVMLDLGFKNLGLKQNRTKNAVGAYFITLASIMRGLSRLKKGDVLVVQYPLKKYYDFVVKQACKRGAEVITVIHDLGCFRRKKLTVEEEIERLNRSSALVVHSPAMQDWLKEQGLTTPTTVLGLFDYLSDSMPSGGKHSVGNRPQLMFAGDVSPVHNEWIYKLSETQPQVDLILYGGGLDRDRATDNMKPMGYVDSDTLIASAKGDYGVVWYGSSLDEGSGALGEYLKYNAPHKTSLYLRAGLPVIIWDKAALAGIVKKLDVGVCVPSLGNIAEVLAGITPERYAQMRANAQKVAAGLSKGNFISEALRKAEKSIDRAAQDN